MKKIHRQKILNSFICLVLSAALIITAMPVDSYAENKTTSNESSGYQVSSQVLSLENDYTSVHMSGTNGGFYISNVEGDKTIKSDNNKELLYHSED